MANIAASAKLKSARDAENQSNWRRNLDANAVYVQNALLTALVGVALKRIIANAVVYIRKARSYACMAIAHHAKTVNIALIVYACAARVQQTGYSNAAI